MLLNTTHQLISPLITKDKNIFTFLEKTIVYLKSMPIFVEQKAIKKEKL